MIAGIIAEYNIFHNGHKYQIDEIKKRSDAVVAVMSGGFVQRGDIAVTDKWTRAGMALQNGADLVLELPVCYALNAAPNFALGGVNTLNALGVIDTIVFGSECGNIDTLLHTAELLEHEPQEISDKIRAFTAEGMSYPSALSSAYGSLINADILCQPNNILAVEYIRALIKSKSKIKPVTIKRTGAGHNDICTTGNFASASQIRSMLFNGSDITPFVPKSANKFPLYSVSLIDSAILSKLRLASPDMLKNINEMTEGLENRIISASKEVYSFSSLAEAVKSKRYTMSKIRRVILASLINFERDIYSPYPEYIRVLGMNKRGMEILKSAKTVCSVPIITKTADFKEKSRQFELDLRAGNIASLCAVNPDLRTGNMDLTTSPVICS